MDLKKLAIGTILGAIVFFVLGKLIYGKLLYQFMGHNPGEIGLIGRREAKYLFMAIGHIAQGLLLSYVILKSNAGSLVAGLTTGAVMGFLMRVGFDCMLYGSTIVISKKGMAADVIAFTLISAVAGAVIGALSGGKQRT